MNFKKLMALLLAVCMLASLLCACGGGNNTPADEGQNGENSAQQGDDSNVSAPGEPQYGGHLDVHIATGINNIDPVRHGGVWNYIYCTPMFENPLTRDAENQIAPGVCDYEVNEDMTVVKLWVRDGLTFHDGTPVEIEDVKASIERGIKVGNGVKEYLGPAIKSMEIADGVLTIEFTKYSELAWSRLAAYQTWLAVMPKEVCEKYPNGDIKDTADFIGTGPYKLSGYELRNFVAVERFDGYVPVTEDRTGYAGIKHAYMDSITFWENTDYSSSTMAIMTGQYDMSDVIESEYQDMAAQAGVIRQNFGDCNTGLNIWFNNGGGENVCAKYPALRKAVMAAIDMPQWAEIVADGACVFGGPPVMDEKYDTGILDETDWYGPTNLDAVEKYMEEAYAAGYDDEPIQLVMSSESTAMTLIMGYLDNAGINYQSVFMDGAAYAEFIIDPMNNWDLGWNYLTGAWTPSTIIDDLISYYYVSEERDTLRAELAELEVDSEEYMAKWQQLHQVMVDDCSQVWIGFLDWYWNYNEDLYCEYEGVHPYVFNAYWANPEEHQD